MSKDPCFQGGHYEVGSTLVPNSEVNTFNDTVIVFGVAAGELLHVLLHRVCEFWINLGLTFEIRTSV